MNKEPIKLKFHGHHALIEDIKYKTPAKNWRPTKRFWSKSNINIKTGDVKDGYVVAKNKEQEKEWKGIVDAQIIKFYKLVWGDKFDQFVENAKYLIDKYGEKEFTKQWEEAMKDK